MRPWASGGVLHKRKQNPLHFQSVTTHGRGYLLNSCPTLDQLLQEIPLVFYNVTIYEGILTPRRIIGFQTGIQYFLVMTVVDGFEESLPRNVVWFDF